MDWNRIETKWHEIARRLQQGSSRIEPSDAGLAQPDPRLEKGLSQDRPDSAPGKTSTDTLARVAG